MRRLSDNATYYGITISKHRKKDYVDKSDLLAVIAKLKQKLVTLDVFDYHYENSGKYRQLHFHGTATSKWNIHYRENNSIDGFRIEWKKIKDKANLDTWMAYTSKEASNTITQDQILQENYYLNNYAFSPSQSETAAMSVSAERSKVLDP